MTYTIIIILIAFLIACGIAATAVQQFNERKALAKREEVSRNRTIYDETEELIVAALQMPVSQTLILVLRNRSLNGLQAMHEFSPNADLHKRIEEINKIIESIDIKAPAPDQNSFKLPSSDKVIIKYIQTVKKLRNTIRAERIKGKITLDLYKVEEKALSNLQLRVNMETLMKRAKEAIDSQMEGSARQYIEKGIAALGKLKEQTEYSIQRKADFEKMKDGLEMNVKDNNLKQIMADKERENKEIDSLFAPKKKW